MQNLNMKWIAVVATQNKKHCSERSKYSSNWKMHGQSISTKVYDYGVGLQTEVIEEDAKRYEIWLYAIVGCSQGNLYK